jgi:hypothetical protein
VRTDVEPDESDPSLLHVLVDYVIKSTKDERTLVYPFYLIPGEE